MNANNHPPESENLDGPLNDAVQALLAESLPEDAVERVKLRARQLATIDGPARSVSVAPMPRQTGEQPGQGRTQRRFGRLPVRLALAAIVAGMCYVGFVATPSGNAGFAQVATQRMATGALIVGVSYLLLAALSWKAGDVSVHWTWFALFWVVLTLGELFILPTGLGLFARLAPARFGATTVASWFLASFAGSLAAGLVGTLWTHMSHPAFFAVLAAICMFSAFALRQMDSRARQLAPELRPQTDPG